MDKSVLLFVSASEKNFENAFVMMTTYAPSRHQTEEYKMSTVKSSFVYLFKIADLNRFQLKF